MLVAHASGDGRIQLGRESANLFGFSLISLIFQMFSCKYQKLNHFWFHGFCKITMS